MNKEDFLRYEKKASRLFINSRKSNRLANAYLLHGERNAPLKETAMYLAKSLSCEKDLLACDNCPSCKRFNDGIRPDFILIDGETTTIKKEDVKNLEHSFSLSALEKGHRLCYVINRIENMTEEASNALLKFLEEPREGQIAFLTSYNITAVLDTIISRSIKVKIDPLNPEAFYNLLLNTDFVDEKNKTLKLNAGQSYVLSLLYSSLEEVKELLSADSSFIEGQEGADLFLTDLALNRNQASFTLLRQASLIKDSKCYNWLYLTINYVFLASLCKDIVPYGPYKEMIGILSKDKDRIRKGEKVISEAIAYKQLNLNPTLVIAKLLQALK